MSAPPVSVIEFCHGYGGATAGLLAAGLHVEMAYDTCPVAVQAHHDWLPQVPCLLRDVKTVTPEAGRGKFVWASLPCQPWSEANTRPENRGKNHPHYYSLAYFAWQVQHARCAIVENVPGLVYRRDGQAELDELRAACARLGLTVTVNLVESTWYGVEQNRKRVFLVIGRNLPLTLLQPSGVRRQGPGLPTVMASDGLSSSLHRRRHARDSDAPVQARSIEECAALQGVPVPSDQLSRKHRFALVGNCVPPKVARGVAEQVLIPLLNR